MVVSWLGDSDEQFVIIGFREGEASKEEQGYESYVHWSRRGAPLRTDEERHGHESCSLCPSEVIVLDNHGLYTRSPHPVLPAFHSILLRHRADAAAQRTSEEGE
jgi:hypothetical protein